MSESLPTGTEPASPAIDTEMLAARSMRRTFKRTRSTKL